MIIDLFRVLEAFYKDARVLNSSLHTCISSTLSTEPSSPTPYYPFLYFLSQSHILWHSLEREKPHFSLSCARELTDGLTRLFLAVTTILYTSTDWFFPWCLIPSLHVDYRMLTSLRSFTVSTFGWRVSSVCTLIPIGLQFLNCVSVMWW